ncbi:BTAD domain-containing putative transcriptional regulator [Streptomyces chartreusis]|uniref:BTAD domain-containing putative transcriptional regulator n=1 Tax=Streptomyces chartreusis TaxID=1969 RepID=UPI0037F40888
MEFKVLGPLEVVSDGRSLPLGGVKQRAVLALLLLHANQVVATSQLLDALWPEDARPVTARKMVQNAVWGLRALLESGDGEAREGTAPQLVTRAPGYVLRLDPERLDATRFERAVAAGRARLDAGEAAEAAVLLGDALAEWRGSALSDLAEQGVEWAELTALRQLRLDAMEDRFEAELACGRHQAVLGELTSLAEAEPLRERLCGQLMLALYRCGRQAEALSVFSKVRQALVEEYGLEPSASLQNLQQRILRHDRALASPTEDRTEPNAPDAPDTSDAQDAGASRRDPAAGENRREAPARDTAVATPEPGQAPALAPADRGTTVSSSCDAPESGDPTSVPSPAPAATDTGDHSRASYGSADTGALAERRDVCVLVVCTESAGDAAAMESEQLDTSLHDAVTALTESVETRSGTIVGSMGGLCAALFGLRSDRPEASLNAVRAAFEARERLAARAGMVMRAVVISGKAIVRHDPHDPRAAVSVVGTLLDKAHGLLTGVPKGELYVSDDVARDTDAWVRYDESTRTADGTVGIREARSLHPAGHGTDTRRRPELALLENLLEYSRHHDVPCMLTVLGDHGVGKTPLLAQVERVLGDLDEVRVLRPRVPKDGYDAAGLATALLEASTPPRHRTPLDPPEQRLRALVRSAVESDVDAARLLRVLCPAPHSGRPAVGAEVLAAWREVIEHAAHHRPLVLCLDDLHLADDVVLDWVESLGGAGTGPLLVVACGHSDLLFRRPLWGSGHEHASRLTLPRLREPAAPTQRRTLPFPDCRPWRQEDRHRVSGRFHGGFRGRGAEPVDVRARRRAM